jgi:Domain of unknown function (DUF4190)
MTSPTDFCQTCGNQMGPSSQFCDRCGTPVGAVSPSPAGAVGQPPYPVAAAPGSPPPPPPHFAPGYAPPPPGYGPPPVGQTTNGLSVASMVLGIVWVFGVGSILAVIFGFVARKQIKDSGGRQSGGGMALAGIILGFVGVASLILWIVLVIAVTTSITNCFDHVQNNVNSSTCVTNSGTGNSGDSFNSGTTGNTGNSTLVPAPVQSSMGQRGMTGSSANSATTPGFTVTLAQ